MTTNDNNGATTTTEVDALLSASGGTTTRTLTCVLPSDRRGPQGNVKLVVSLRDGLGADVIMNGTDVVVGQPRFILDHSLIPMYGEDIVSFKYFELSGVASVDSILSSLTSVRVGIHPCSGIQIDSALSSLSCLLPRHLPGATTVQMFLNDPSPSQGKHVGEVSFCSSFFLLFFFFLFVFFSPQFCCCCDCFIFLFFFPPKNVLTLFSYSFFFFSLHTHTL